MKTHEFTIIVSGLDPEADDFEDRFYEAGCGDATISHQKGVIIGIRQRSADLRQGADIGAFRRAADRRQGRTDRTRLSGEPLRHRRPVRTLPCCDLPLLQGGAGGGVPGAGRARDVGESPLWDWVDVSRWMVRHSKLSRDDVVQARMVREANLVAQSQTLKRDQFVKQLEKRAAEFERVDG